MEYLIKSTVILSIFYAFYKVVLQKETFFTSIRAYFLIGIISAIALPFVTIYKYIEVNAMAFTENLAYYNMAQTLEVKTFDWSQLFIRIYIIGVVIFASRFIFELSTLLRFLIKSEKIKKGKYFIIKTNRKSAPFSFFNYIVYNPDQFKEDELKQIITHEKIHASQWHSMDTILSQFMVIINWFNPLVWLYNKEIQKNLEFLADGFAQNYTHEKKNYQYLLLKTISPDYQMALTNNFYNSLIKNRINMLQKNRSNKVMYFKFALIIPMLIAFVFTFNTEVIAQDKKMKLIEVQENIELEIITKDFTKTDLQQLKTRLAAKGVQFKYAKLKYNSLNEITSIDVTVKSDKGNQAKLSQSNKEPISPIKIKIDNATGNISLGNMSNIHQENVFFTSKDKNKFIIKKTGDKEDHLVWTIKDSTKVIDLQGENGFVFISDDDHAKGEKHIIKVHKGDHKSKVWVSKDGDTTNMKKIEIIEIDHDGNDKFKIITKSKISDGDHDEIIIKTDNFQSKKGNMMFIDTDGKKPLFIVDGKEVSNGKLEDFDHKNIETVSVLKGEKAIEKYGEKGKDGVVIIKTKK